MEDVEDTIYLEPCYSEVLARISIQPGAPRKEKKTNTERSSVLQLYWDFNADDA